mmetsp:Transcript_3232/g.4638  ORF Transcript_3232/g.4638 Transcript_3232/m.4638 type:complete len:293 (-) Transcript_3232:340-1218(-)|eukprot:CAMPEP_0175093570 /NCGR_PEP_ID=MMETSP0086_2-20121207/3094_1 /TAXON_ID=136419 /ORGANISM="Unknown Unknown, Strain D1" /LENGTH=292 /DNA_ID=CAMNT_0016366563 /DNA_START=57 /DNA_END=935 /DNA_ORIENTATION=+
MGCCSSKATKADINPEDEITAIKDDPLPKNTDGSARPASSTVTHNRDSFSDYLDPKKKPGKLSLDVSARQAAQGNPNAINTTPHGDASGFQANDEKKHEEDENRLAMWIPWEKPILGGKSASVDRAGVGSRSKRRAAPLSASKSKSTTRLPGGPKSAKGKPESVFIPGSGNEKILLSSKATNIQALPPLEYKKVKAHGHVKAKMEKDKEERRRARQQVKDATESIFKQICGDRDLWSDDRREKQGLKRLTKLIKEYAEIGVAAPTEFLVVSKEHAETLSNNSRVNISCPVRQ